LKEKFMGGIAKAEKDLKAAIHKFGDKAERVLEPVWGLIREAARSKEFTVPKLTIYVPEDIGLGDTLKKELNRVDMLSGQITGIFIPEAVKPDTTVNVILFMHGDKVRLWDQTGTVRDYWNLPGIPLRQGLNTSKKNFILVAPTLGRKAGSEFGNLGTNIDDHLDHILEALHQLGAPEFKLSKAPDIGQLIIAGHSGAYGPITDLLASIQKYRKKITEFWFFDILYPNLVPNLASFTQPIYAYFVNGSGTESNSRKLAATRRSNVFVMENVDFDIVKGKEQRRAIKHDFLMQRFWLDRCQRIGTNGTDPDDKKRMIKG